MFYSSNFFSLCCFQEPTKDKDFFLLHRKIGKSVFQNKKTSILIHVDLQFFFFILLKHDDEQIFYLKFNSCKETHKHELKKQTIF